MRLCRRIGPKLDKDSSRIGIPNGTDLLQNPGYKKITAGRQSRKLSGYLDAHAKAFGLQQFSLCALLIFFLFPVISVVGFCRGLICALRVLAVKFLRLVLLFRPPTVRGRFIFCR